MWLSLSTLVLFWTPSLPTRISLVITGLLTALDLLLLIAVPQLFHRESLLTMLACFLALLVTGICLLSNRLIQAAKEEEVSPTLSSSLQSQLYTSADVITYLCRVR